jgi:hypothetical protein
VSIVLSDGTEITLDEFIQNYLAPNIDFTGALKCTSKINNNSILIAPNLNSLMGPEDTGAVLWASELHSSDDSGANVVQTRLHVPDFILDTLPRYMPIPIRGVRMPE